MFDEAIMLDSPVIPALGRRLQSFLTAGPRSLLLKSEYPQLKAQWEEALQSLGLSKNHAVLC